MASLKRHFSPETPFMELSNAIFLHSHYRSGGDSGEIYGWAAMIDLFGLEQQAKD